MAEDRNVAHAEHEALEHSESHALRYLWVWVALLAFTTLTWALSRLHIPGGWGVTVALAIAATKGGLVALFFMHLWDQRGANRLVFITSLVFVALLVSLTMLDDATRFPLTNPPGSELNPMPAAGMPPVP